MNKKFVTCAIVFILIGLIIPQVYAESFTLEDHYKTTENKNQYDSHVPNLLDNNRLKSTSPSYPPEEEGDHFPCGVEYWWLYTMLTLEDGRQWDICAQFFYEMNWTGTQWSETDGDSYIRIQSWDRGAGKCFDNIHNATNPGPFEYKKNILDLKFFNSTMYGLYPDYNAYFDDDVNNIKLTVDFHAISPPYEHLKGAVNGTIPVGLGTYKYWSFPYVEITAGVLSINGTNYNVTGVGYFEHLYGDRLVDYTRIPSLSNLINVGSLYLSLADWLLQGKSDDWLKTYDPCITTDNLYGMDWIWATFDNGWSMIFYRLRFAGLPLGYAEGPCIGVLMLSNSENIWEFNDVYIKITRDVYLPESDLPVPLDFQITGFKDNKEAYIAFNSTTNMTKTCIGKFAGSRGWMYLAAGNAAGYFKEGGNTSSLLNGKGTNTPMLLEPFTNYSSTKIEFLLPPYGLGITITLRMPSIRIEVHFILQLQPTYKLRFYITPLEKNREIPNIKNRFSELCKLLFKNRYLIFDLLRAGR